MKPRRSFLRRAEEQLGPYRAEVVAARLASAMESADIGTKMGGLHETRRFELFVAEPRRGLRSIELPVGIHILGRSNESLVVCHDRYVSRRHAVLTLHDDDRMVLRDLGTQNRILFAGARVLKVRPLPLGQSFQLGCTTMWVVPADSVS